MTARLRTVGKVTAGFGLLIIGGVLALPGVPGPGLVVMFAGVCLLSEHFAWARKTRAWCREKVEQAKRRAARRPE